MIVIVTLSFVITSCGAISNVCCFKLTMLLTWSTNGIIIVKPASATLWNLPNLSMIYTSDCLTILTLVNKNNKIIPMIIIAGIIIPS